MRHDQACERARWRVDQGCECASRAWASNPLPATDLPLVVEYNPLTDLWVEL